MQPGDMLIQDESGRLFVLSAREFEQRYEPA
jgi:hypothetical protein